MYENEFFFVLGWLVGLGVNGPLRQYFSLYRAVSQKEGERGKKGDESKERIDESKNVQTTPPAPIASASFCNLGAWLAGCFGA